MRHTISVLVENKFGVLARVSGMFSGRGFNIDTLNVGPTEDSGVSRITATVMGDESSLDQCVKQLDKLVNVIAIENFSKGEPFVARELVLMKVAAGSDKRSEVVEIAKLFDANIVNVSPHSLIIECSANENKMKAFMEMMSSYEILELARTGNVALARRDKEAS